MLIIIEIYHMNICSPPYNSQLCFCVEGLLLVMCNLSVSNNDSDALYDGYGRGVEAFWSTLKIIIDRKVYKKGIKKICYGLNLICTFRIMHLC